MQCVLFVVDDDVVQVVLIQGQFVQQVGEFIVDNCVIKFYFGVFVVICIG